MNRLGRGLFTIILIILMPIGAFVILFAPVIFSIIFCSRYFLWLYAAHFIMACYFMGEEK